MKSEIEKLTLTNDEVRLLQKNILELLLEFDRICRKYDIPYSIDGGTFLGAVRHKGFIPWDTDADIVILREDYLLFKEACKNELDESQFFLQDYNTDPYYRWAYSRLLLKGTTYVRAGYDHIPAQNGVFLDIFIMDSVPDNILLRKCHRAACYCIQKILWSEAGKIVHPSRLKRVWFSMISKVPRNTVFSFRNWIIRIQGDKKTELICHMGSPHPKRLPYGFPRKLFNSLDEYEFEGHRFLGFKHFDWYLKSIYGDYTKLPPKSERVSHIPCSKLVLKTYNSTETSTIKDNQVYVSDNKTLGSEE